MTKVMSAKRIVQYLKVTLEGANQIRGVIKNEIKPMTFQSVQDWVKQCHNEPSYHEKKMCALNEILGGYGVEAVQESGNYQTVPLEYINMGDTYTATICFYEGAYHFTTWGDAVEYLERKGVSIQ